MSAAPVVLSPPLTTTKFPLDGPVEPVTNAPAVDYDPFLAEKKYHKTSPPQFLTLTEEQEGIYQEVLKHFAAGGYVIPGFEGVDGILTEEEKFYLVRFPSLIFSAELRLAF